MRTLRISDNSISRQRPAIILALLLASAGLAYLTPSRRFALVFFGAGLALPALMLYLKRPALGVLSLVFSALMVPFSIGTGTGTDINPVVMLVPVLTGIWLLDMALTRRAIRLHRHPAVYAVLMMCVVVLLAFIAGQLPWFSIPGAGIASQLGGVSVFLLSAAAFLLVAHVLDEHWLRWLVALFLTITGLFLLGRILPPLGLINRLYATGALGSVFWTWAVALGCGVALFGRGLRPGVRLAAGGVGILTLLYGLTQQLVWASGWAPPGVALLILIWLRFPRWGWILILAAIVAFIIRQQLVISAVTSTNEWVARRQAWRIVLDAVSANPLLGLGPSNYYFYVQQYDIAGWGGVWNVRFNSHNNWVDIIGQTGVLGLLTVLWFAAAMGRAGWQLYRRLPDGFPRAYAAACLAGLIATLISGMLGDWFLPFVYNIGLAGMRSSILFWVFMGGLLALHMAEGFLHNSPG